MTHKRIGPVELFGSRRGWHKLVALMSVGVAFGSMLSIQPDFVLFGVSANPLDAGM